MQFSVIVPMYNVESYLDKCVESIVSQSYNDFEILLIDDHSTDNTLQMAQSWENKDNRIKIIKKEFNSGLSATRNIGIKNAKGDYLVFVDSDDYLDIQSMEVFNGIIQSHHPDIVYAGFFQETIDGISEKKYGFVSNSNKLYSTYEYMRSELEQRNLYAAAAFGIYNRKKIIDRNLFFKEGILHEDEEWTPRVLLNLDTVYLSEFNFYHYIKRPGSITTKAHRTQNGLDLMQTCIQLELYSSNIILDSGLLKLYKNQLAKLYMKAVCIGKINRKEYKNRIDKLFPIRNACKKFDVIKSILFAISPNLYFRVYKIWGDEQ